MAKPARLISTWAWITIPFAVFLGCFLGDYQKLGSDHSRLRVVSNEVDPIVSYEHGICCGRILVRMDRLQSPEQVNIYVVDIVPEQAFLKDGLNHTKID